MANVTSEYGHAVNITATGAVGAAAVSCVLLGFYVNSTTTGTLVLRRGGASGTVISGTITPAIGFHRFPASCPDGLHATIANTLDVTLFIIPGQA